DTPGDQRPVLQASLAEERLKKYPNDFSANFDMGDMLLSKGDAQGAITYFERATKANPESVVGATELGVALSAGSRPGEAEEQFKKALQLDPKYIDARFNLASVEAENGELETAVADFKLVILQRSDYPKAQERVGDVLFAWGDQLAKSGDNEQAVLRYRDALGYRANDVELHTSLGAALARLGHMKEARAELETAVRINPDFEPARKILGAIP
ncbi:MAG: tetratricopeptide repeat protein, partial [Acidobacteriota bacterium]|nr:tetratricopeptide repeat protein [Acidobacteriota bacterium]